MNIHDMALTLAETLLRSQFPAGMGDTPTPKRLTWEQCPFTVTISREVGALGTTTAQEIGKRLNWPVYDQEIINKIAEEMRKPTTHVRGVDERYFSWLEECMANLLTEYHVSPTSYMKHLIETVRGLGAKGRCVIVGRGANFILPREKTLRVRLVAELKDRITNIGRLKGVSDREAASWIDTTEKERLRFIRGNFAKEPDDPHYYDLVLNTSILTPVECADIIIDTLQLMMKRSETTAEVQASKRGYAETREVAVN